MKAFTGEIWQHKDKVFARLLFILFISTVLFYLALLLYATGSGEYSFVHDDEFNYVGAAKLFSQTGSVRAPLCMLEEVSKIFGANWYGVSYSIFYGSLYYIFGNHAVIFIFLNILFILLSSIMILRAHVSSYKKLFALEMLLLSYPFIVYTFMFFPELLHLYLAIVLFMLLFKIYQVHLSGGNFRGLIVLYVLLCIIFSLFRITSVFWIAGIIPFVKNIRQLSMRILIFIAGIVLVMIYMHYFIAPAFVYPMGSIDALKQLNFEAFFNMVTKYMNQNLIFLFSITIREPQVLILMLLFGWSAFKSIRKRDKLYMASLFISLCYFAALISFYNTHPFYFTKQTAVLVPLLIFPIAFSSGLLIRKIALICFLVASPFYFVQAKTEIESRKKAGYDLSSTYTQQISELKKISALVDQEKANLIEFVHYEHKYPRYIFYDALPLSNGNNYPITYTASVYNESLYPDMGYNGRFPRYGLLKVNYVLSRDSLQLEKLEMIYHSPFYNLYKDNR